MADDNKNNSTHTEINSPVELEQPCVFANTIPGNILLGDFSRHCNSSDAAAVLSSVDDKVEGIIDIKGTGNHQLSLKDDQVSSASMLSNLDSGSSDREGSLESNKGVSSSLTTVKENVMTDNPHSVDEVADKGVSSPVTTVEEVPNMSVSSHLTTVEEVPNMGVSSPLTTVDEVADVGLSSPLITVKEVPNMGVSSPLTTVDEVADVGASSPMTTVDEVADVGVSSPLITVKEVPNMGVSSPLTTVDEVADVGVSSPMTTVDEVADVGVSSPMTTVEEVADVGVSSPLTTVDEVADLGVSSPMTTVDEVADLGVSSPMTTVDEVADVGVSSPLTTLEEVPTMGVSSPLTTVDEVSENVKTGNSSSADEIATDVSARGECPSGNDLVEVPGSDIKLWDKHVSLDNKKTEETLNNVADSVNCKDVTDRSENGHREIDAEKQLKEGHREIDAEKQLKEGHREIDAEKQLKEGHREIDAEKQLKEGHREIDAEKQLKEAENMQAAPRYTEHVEELDYEENDADDGGGRPDKLPKEDQENQDGQSDKDEGELTDDDCEEGEIKEPGSRKPFIKPMCRFFQRGSCSWGPSCRFLHPGVNDMGNYQLIELPGSAPAGVRARLGVPDMWPELEEEAPLPPPLLPEIPLVETAWERGLRLAKERKKAAERKEKEPDFEEKRLNLSVDNEWEVNKENERLPVVTSKNPYYAPPECEVDEYYKVPSEPWPPGHYENNQVRYNQDRAFSPPYRVKPPVATSAPYDLLYGPPEKFDRERLGLPEPIRLEAAPVTHIYTSSKRPDEWTDPWSRSKPSKTSKSKSRGTSRGRRKHRSASDDSHSSRSRSKSSGSSRSSRSYSSSSDSSSPKSTEAAAPSGDRRERYVSPPRDQMRSGMPARGPGPYPGYHQNSRGNNSYQRGGYHVSNGSGGYHGNSYGGGNARPAGGYAERNVRDRSRDRTWKQRGRSPPDRPLPYVRPRPKSASSNSESSRSRSRSRNRISSSRSRSSSGSSRSSSSSSSSAGSADSDHLYRDLGNPLKKPQTPASGKKSKINSRTTNGTHSSTPSAAMPAFRLDQIPHPQDPKPPLPASVKAEPKYASRNVPLPPVKPKDPLKVVGQKSNIKLTLLPKSSLGSRPNPLDSPPRKRQLDRDMSSPESPPPAKHPNLASEASVLRLASEKAAKLTPRAVVKPLPVSLPQSAPPSSSSSSSSLASGSPMKPITVSQSAPPSSSSSSSSLASGSPMKAIIVPQKQQAAGVKPRTMEPAAVKTAQRAPATNTPAATTAVVKAKKTVVSRREELLKQLKAVEDAIAKKKGKLA
ncbi:hypothetical protein BsWGS_22223 [Bradybaena similaris]